MAARGALVSICVPAFNGERTIAETLRSLLAQTYDNLEVVVCDNASTDRTVDVVRSFSDSRLRLVLNESHVSAEGNFDRCLRLGRGRYRGIFHSDDVYEPTIIEKQVAFLEGHPDAAAVGTRMRLIRADGSFWRTQRLPRRFRGGCIVGYADGLRQMLRTGSFVVTPSVLARSKVYDGLGPWDRAGFGSAADVDVWLRIMRLGGLGLIDEPLVNYRWGPQSFSFRRLQDAGEPDILRVLRAHMANPDIQPLLRPADMRAFDRFVRRSRVLRANAAHLAGDDDQARSLLQGMGAGDALLHAATSLTGVRLLALGLLVRADLVLGGFLRTPLRAIAQRWW